MLQTLTPLFSFFDPPSRFSEEDRFQVRTHRLITLLGACFVLAFGPLYAVANPEATDPFWARLLLAGLLVSLFGASYVSRRVLAAYVPCLRAILYVLTAWFATLSGLNNFSVDYAIGMLMVYAVLTAVVGFGADSLSPVLWFLGYGFFVVTGAAALSSSPVVSLSVLFANMGTIAVVEGILIRGWLGMRDTVRRQASRLRGFTNSLPGVVFQFYARDNGDVGHYFVSDKAEDVLGVEATPDTFHEQCLEHVPDEALPDLHASIRRAVEEGAGWEFETPFVRPDGERRWVLGTSTPEYRDDEVVYNGVILDITERRQAEYALEEERDRLEILFEVLPTPVVRCVATGNELHISDANPAFEETFGWVTDSVEGRRINELLVPPGDERRARELDRRTLEEESVRTEVERLTSEGPRHFQAQAACRRPQKGPPEVYIVYIDITDRKKRERRLQAIFNQTYQFTGLTEPDGTMVEANDTALQFGDLTREQVVGKKLWETHWAQTGQESKEKLKAAVQRAAGGEFVRYQRPVQGRDETRMTDFSIRPITNDDGEVTLLIPEARDITELKQREERLRAAKQEAEEARVEAETASRAKTVMLANMSHEIRTPLTSVIGFAEAIGEEVEETDSISQFAGLIKKSGERLLDTLDGVLNLSELEAGKVDFEASSVNLSSHVRDIVEEFQPQVKDRPIRIRAETDGASVQALADERGVSIILQNLVSNAIKYTEQGDVVVRARRREDAAVLEVEDEGEGMAPSQVESLFKPFRQESEGIDRRHEGTGLGLSIAKRATEQMDGRIDVDTKKGVGSRFTVQLPVPGSEDAGP